MKHPTYNGVALLIVAKTADNNNVPLALAIVPLETTDHFLWLFLNLKAGGVLLNDCAIFCDCGKQMKLQQQLLKFECNRVHLKNCTYHLAQNICYNLSPNDNTLKNLFFCLQSTELVPEYIDVMVVFVDAKQKKI
jgi:hypothetical protein